VEYPIGSRSLASKVEFRLKNLSKTQKQDTLGMPGRIDEILAGFQVGQESAR
jgi:hypothetical protein